MDRSLLPQHPARVEVTARDGVRRWLGQASSLVPQLADDVTEAGVFPWQDALARAKAAHQPWRRQRARAVEVAERCAVGAEARVRAAGMGLPDAAEVRCLVFGPGPVLVLRSGGRRELLPAIALA